MNHNEIIEKYKRLVPSWQKAAAAAVLVALSYVMFQWAMEGAVHSRPQVSVPDLKGRSADVALGMLSAIHLGLSQAGSEFDNSVPINSILRQDPLPGAVVREGKIVKVVISQGSETVFVPSLVGLPLRNSEMLLRDNRLVLGQVSQAYSLTLERGTVLSQDPAAEASVPSNSAVNIAVSQGPPPSGVSLMPDFQRKTEAEAQQWAATSGVKIAVTKDYNSLFPYGVILSQTPPRDAVLSADTAVAFVISGRASENSANPAAKVFHYELSQGSSESRVRIVVVDQYGEREIFDGVRPPGSKIDVPLEEAGSARVKIYVDGILIEERDL